MSTPSFVGITLPNALVIASEQNLNLRFLSDKIDPELPNNTILSQTPIAGQNIRPHQSVYLVLSKTAPSTPAPDCLEKNKEQISQQLEKKSIAHTFYYHSSNYPENSCFAQSPSQQHCIKNNNFLLYISKNKNKPLIFPNVIGKQINNVVTFFNEYKLRIKIIHTKAQPEDHVCNEHCIITNQRPVAGSIVTLDKTKPLLVQLQIN